MQRIFLLCAIFVVGSLANVIDVDDNSFFKHVAADDKTIVAVAFKAEWCGHCKALEPEWRKFAAAVSPFVKVVSIDADKNKQIASRYQIQGFPTIKFFVGKESPIDYNSGRTADALADFAQKLIGKTIQTRISGKKSSSSNNNKSSSSSSSSSSDDSSAPVVELTEANFQKEVIDSDDIWLVEFFAPWCGWCKKLKPEWDEAARQLDGDVKLGTVDATVHSSLAQTYGVQGYPTIKLFVNGQVTPYEGGRTAADIIAFGNEQLRKKGSGDIVPQLINNEQFEKKCKSKTTICVLAFLPHILDDFAQGRNARLEVLREVAKKMADKPFKFFWAEGGEQFSFEEKLNLGFGYPAVVAISTAKSRFATMASSFDTPNVSSFLDSVLSGKARYNTIAKIPEIKKTSPWDGQDLPPPQE